MRDYSHNTTQPEGNTMNDTPLNRFGEGEQPDFNSAAYGQGE